MRKKFINHMSDTDLVWRMYNIKNSLTTQPKKDTMTQLKNGQRTSTDISPKDDTQMANRHKKRCLKVYLVPCIQENHSISPRNCRVHLLLTHPRGQQCPVGLRTLQRSANHQSSPGVQGEKKSRFYIDQKANDTTVYGYFTRAR